MKKAVFTLLLMSFCWPCFASTGTTGDIGDFLYSAPFRGPVEKGVLYVAPLPEEILRNCARDCADARIYDRDGKEIPYAMIENRGNYAAGERYLFEIIGYETNKKKETVTIRLPEKHQAISAIKIYTYDRDFKRKVAVYGSYDQKTWNPVTEDGVWDFTSQVDLRKTGINFPEAHYRYYRLILAEAGKERGEGEGIRLRYRDRGDHREFDFSAGNGSKGRMQINRIEGLTPVTTMKPVYDEAVLASPSPRKDGEATVIDFYNAVPFERVLFDIGNPYYFRRVSIYFSADGGENSYRFIASGQVYSFPLSDKTEASNSVECPGSGKGYYRLVIENRSNPPLEVRNIKFQRVRRSLYFIALSDSSPYTLWLGNHKLKRPDYDISHFINQCNWYTRSATPLEIEHLSHQRRVRSGFREERRAGIEKAVLTAIVTLLVGVIGYWLYSLVKNADLKKGGRQE